MLKYLDTLKEAQLHLLYIPKLPCGLFEFCFLLFLLVKIPTYHKKDLYF